MNDGLHLTVAGNTYNGCLLILREKGCTLSIENLGDDGIIWRAQKGDNSFSADSPVELLGLFSLWENLGSKWNHQYPDILEELFSKGEIDGGSL